MRHSLKFLTLVLFYEAYSACERVRRELFFFGEKGIFVNSNTDA